MILVADSGSTKTSWITIDGQTQSEVYETAGINPVRDNSETILKIINEIKDFPNGRVETVHFYGAGCIPPYSDTVREALENVFPCANISVESDMLGAAIALCGHHEGIACILGTGANSCLFDGEKIVQQTPALGFILGDEGSGAVLGKRLVSDILKQQLPMDIIQLFNEEMQLNQADVISRIYRSPQPNLFLSSLVPFLHRHLNHPSIQHLVIEEFRRFLRRNINNYNRLDLQVNFVGGITNSFADQLKIAVRKEGMIMGRTIQKPIVEMANYHKH